MQRRGDQPSHIPTQCRAGRPVHTIGRSAPRLGTDAPPRHRAGQPWQWQDGHATRRGIPGILNAIQHRYRHAGDAGACNARSSPAQGGDVAHHKTAPQQVRRVTKGLGHDLRADACWVSLGDGYGLHASNGILFNHESPRRGETFVTRKITRAVAAIKAGKQEKVFLGNLTAVRDWGYAKEYVESMWLMLQQDKPSDYVVATGVGATVKDFAEAAFTRAGLNWQDHIETDKKYIRPTEVDALIGDPSKAEQALGWKAKTHWKELAELMVDADIEALKK